MLSYKRYSLGIPMPLAEAGIYGINSIELLIKEELKLGAEKRYLKAKAFGGEHGPTN